MGPSHVTVLWKEIAILNGVETKPDCPRIFQVQSLCTFDMFEGMIDHIVQFQTLGRSLPGLGTAVHRWTTEVASAAFDPPVETFLCCIQNIAKIVTRTCNHCLLTIHHLPLRYHFLYFVCFALAIFVLQPGVGTILLQ